MAAPYQYVLGPVVEHSDNGLRFYGPPSGCLSWVDLRSIPKQASYGQTGHAFFTMPADWVRPSEYTLLGGGTGDLRSLYFAAADQAAWASLIGTKIPRNASTMLVDALALQLTDYSDPTGDDGPKPLVAATPPPGPPPTADILLAGHSRVWSREYHHDKPGLRWTQRVRDLWRADLTRIAQQDDVLWRKVLGAEKQKHGQRWDDQNEVHLLPPGLAKERSPENPGRPVSERRFAMRPETTYTESFDGSDSSTLGQDLTWTEVADDWSNTSNMAQFEGNGTATHGLARAEHDVSSSDHYAQCDIESLEFGFATQFGGVACRFSASASTCYVARLSYTVANRHIAKIVSGTLTVLSSLLGGTVPCTLVMRANGSTLTADYNGSQYASLTDTSISGNTRGGLYCYWGSASMQYPQFDDWSIADLAAATGGGQLLLLGVG